MSLNESQARVFKEFLRFVPRREWIPQDNLHALYLLTVEAHEFKVEHWQESQREEIQRRERSPYTPSEFLRELKRAKFRFVRNPETGAPGWRRN